MSDNNFTPDQIIRVYEPDIQNYKKSAIECIEDGWISNHGRFVEEATNKLKTIVNIPYCILMCNGTCATHFLFLSIKYKYPNINKIYVPNNCYVAAWNAVLMEYDINQMNLLKMDIDTWNIDTSEEYIKTLDTNSAMLVVHNVGNIINIPRLKKIRPDIIFVEDNCEGMFGKHENSFSGMSTSSLCSSCSFYGNKIITTGEGGAFFTNDEDLYNYVKSAYAQGQTKQKFLHDTHAYNYRMTNIQAGFLYDQLNNLDNILQNKYKIFNNYENLLEPLIAANKIKLMKKEENTLNAPWMFTLRIVNNKYDINNLIDIFKKENIDIRPFFYPINNHKHLEVIKNDDSISYLLNREIIMLPSSPTITYQEQSYIIRKLIDII